MLSPVPCTHIPPATSPYYRYTGFLTCICASSSALAGTWSYPTVRCCPPCRGSTVGPSSPSSTILPSTNPPTLSTHHTWRNTVEHRCTVHNTADHSCTVHSSKNTPIPHKSLLNTAVLYTTLRNTAVLNTTLLNTAKLHTSGLNNSCTAHNATEL